MEKYLKMSDVFKRGVLHNDGSPFVRDLCSSDIAWFNYDAIDDRTQAAKYSAHAINSHDELVAMNKELLAALECAEGFVSEVSEKTGFGQVHTLKVIRSSIAKAKASA